MKFIILVLALILTWEQVETDVDGNPLAPGNEITQSLVYRCGSNNCTKSNGVLVGTVPYPTKTFDITSQPRPSTYFITAVNASGESSESNTIRVTPPRSPNNLQFRNQ